MLRDYITELYQGIVLPDYSMELYYGIILQSYVTGLCEKDPRDARDVRGPTWDSGDPLGTPGDVHWIPGYAPGTPPARP